MENYKNSISNYQLQEDEVFCLSCNRVLKSMNLRRHANSKSHENKVVKIIASKFAKINEQEIN